MLRNKKICTKFAPSFPERVIKKRCRKASHLTGVIINCLNKCTQL